MASFGVSFEMNIWAEWSQRLNQSKWATGIL